MTDLYAPGGDEFILQEPNPLGMLHRKEGKRPAIFIRFR